MELFMYVIAGIIGVCILGIVVMMVFAKLRGNANVQVITKELTGLKLLSIDENKALFTMHIPIKNLGSQESAVVDAFARPFLPQEQFKDAVAYAYLENSEARRNDNYFEAVLIPAGVKKDLIITLEFVARNNKNIKEVLSDMVDMDIAIYVDGSARKGLYVHKGYITIMGEEIKLLVGGKN